MFKLILFFLLYFSSFSVSQRTVPEWAKGVVWYQIFPERFRNGDTANDPEAFKVFAREDSIINNWEVTRWTSNWFAQSYWEKQLGGNVRDHLYQRRYGGDIQGIIDMLDYLKALGVGAIYLNPVFEAASLHKYDGSTFHHIDVNFGPYPDDDRKLIASEIPDRPETWVWTSADKLFLKLIQEVHSRGMRIIIDGVFNHTGVEFWAFKDIVQKGENSVYKDWYMIESFDDPLTSQNEFKYKGWWNIRSLPEFNRTDYDLHPGPKQYIYLATARWMDPDGDGDPSDGIDGWRLDVARDVPLGFWKDWSKFVKTLNSEALIVGELWELSPDFISKAGPFDALMNYNFSYAVKELFIDKNKKISVSEFIHKLEEVENTYPPDNLFVLQNLITSHDTERLSSLIKNPNRNYDRDADERNPDYDPSKPTQIEIEIQKLIAAFQITYLGAPMIYYGDEVGMWGADDPHCRKPMVWDDLNYDDEIIDKNSGFSKGYGTYTVEQNTELLLFYRNMIEIRNTFNELKAGEVKFLYSNNDKKSFAFERTYESNIVIVSFNLGDEADEIPVSLNNKNVSITNLLSAQAEIINNKSTKNSTFNFNLEPGTFKLYYIQTLD